MSADRTVATPAVGLEMTPMSWATGPANWSRFAAVNDEFIGIHLDDAIAQRAGFPSAIGMGNLQYSYMHVALRGWFGPESTIERVDIRFKRPNLKDQVVTVAGRITSLEPIGSRVRLEVSLSVTADDGTSLSSGVASVCVPGEAS